MKPSLRKILDPESELKPGMLLGYAFPMKFVLLLEELPVKDRLFICWNTLEINQGKFLTVYISRENTVWMIVEGTKKT